MVGGFNPSEKYESQLGLLFLIYGKKKMFQTTNQLHGPLNCGLVDWLIDRFRCAKLRKAGTHHCQGIDGCYDLE